ncbi:hypothetical protein D3C87_1616660 [compost metagenome]
MIAGRQRRQQHQNDGRQARRRQHGAIAALQRRHGLFQRLMRVQAVAAIRGNALTRRALPVQRGVGRGVGKADRAGAHHRHVHRP